MSRMVVNYVISLPRFDIKKIIKKRGRLKTRKGDLCKRRVKKRERERERERELARLKT